MIRVVGDVHGKIDQYKKLVAQADRSVQLGDMGFDYSKIDLDMNNHVFIGGNHDNYSVIHHCRNSKVGHGLVKWPELTFFWMSGAKSIDTHLRTPGKDWWPEEELNYKLLNNAYKFYQCHHPNIVMTHDVPQVVARHIFNCTQKGNTRICLDEMFQEYPPKMWFFGHWHKNIAFNMCGTTFIGLAELSYFDFFFAR